EQLVLEPRGEAKIAAADRHTIALEARMSLKVVDRQRRLYPSEAVFLEDRHQRQTFVRRRPCRCRIDHELDIFADMFACGADQQGRMLEIIAPERVGDNLDGA